MKDIENKEIENDIDNTSERKKTKHKDYKDNIKNPIVREIVEWIEVIIIAFVLAIVVKTFIVEPTNVSGRSMQPTLHDSEKLVINRFIYKFTEPKRGDIIVFLPENSTENYIKRVIGLPGDEISIEDEHVYINGVMEDEEYTNTATHLVSYGVELPITVPEGEYFVMGDNRDHSQDSRAIGTITKDQIRGEAFFRLTPFDKFGTFKKETYNVDKENEEEKDIDIEDNIETK